jgi:hypothetical protein
VDLDDGRLTIDNAARASRPFDGSELDATTGFTWARIALESISDLMSVNSTWRMSNLVWLAR